MNSPLRPPSAVTIWIVDNILCVELPNLHGENTHYLKLPNNVWGMTQLVNIINARDSESRIGTKGDPTQAQAEAEMKRLAKGIDPTVIKRKQSVKTTPEMRSTLKDLVRSMFR